MRKARNESIRRILTPLAAAVLCAALNGTAGAQNQAKPASTAGMEQGAIAGSAGKATSDGSKAQSTGTASAGQSSSVAGAAPSAATAAALAKIDPAKEADIRRLLDAIGTTALVQKVMDNMVQSMKPVMTNSLPPGQYRDTLVDLFFQKFRSKFETKQMLDLAVVRYDENFSDEEIRGLTDFYLTPLGKKVASLLPKITTEMQQDGQKLGERMGRVSMTEVLLEHPELAKAMQDAARGGSGDLR